MAVDSRCADGATAAVQGGRAVAQRTLRHGLGGIQLHGGEARVAWVGLRRRGGERAGAGGEPYCRQGWRQQQCGSPASIARHALSRRTTPTLEVHGTLAKW